MTSSCLECSDRPQSGQFGLCDQCRRDRRDRVRGSLRASSTTEASPAGDEQAGQVTLDAWGGRDA